MIDEAIDGEMTIVPSTNIATNHSRLAYIFARTATVVAIYVDAMKVATGGRVAPARRDPPLVAENGALTSKTPRQNRVHVTNRCTTPAKGGRVYPA
ncbi:hypothetical protein [Mycobacterium sp.]|uniref:hypothetical protein n=1 Tax=Mycobacterium sp. TaxID=1785 RepID=UPI003F9AF507